ncbi:hypothetical protein ICR95_25250 (plasmid) [Priestia megaterium]|uniref:hypothetical protein n=1 Tax=Priestia megaterium TaxID=1404 RepID=UPI00196A5CD0|nr:hypothetical protein [Priestia megaterium]QSF35962.1 hypothetical protein ICR95_25250 [Priestia megaterium]
MIYTVDRVQFEASGQLVFFEFYNDSNDNEQFVRRKFESLSKISKESLFFVKYNDNYRNENGVRVWSNGKNKTYKWNEYKQWFLSKNGEALNNSVLKSKPLGSATDNEGDPYINEILKEVHEISFCLDDNGLSITKEALGKESTYGFDFDIFDDINKTLVEFLNNETKQKGKNPIENTQAHPMRYAWISDREQEEFAKKMKKEKPSWKNPRKIDNRQKYISLWRAKQKLEGELYLVNYNKNDKTEDLSIIEVVDLDEDKGIMGDISYKVTYKDMVSWLEKMNTDPVAAKQYLTTFPKEIRNIEFWLKYYSNQEKYPIPKRSHIGKDYK